MANNIKKDQILVKAWYLGVLLCIVAVIAALLICGFSKYKYNMEKSFTVKIDSAEDLERLGESIYNDKLILQNDIHITDSNFRIGSAQHPFEGTFDGNGYTVIFDFPTVESNYSFFNDVTAKARIVNTTFDFGSLRINSASFGGIVSQNEGVIMDCKVRFDKLVVNKTGDFSPFVIRNNGTIVNCVVSGTINNEQLNKEDEKSVNYGNLCVYNSGIVKNVVAIVKYENFLCTKEENIFSHSTDNNGIGSIVSKNFYPGTVEKALAVVDKGSYFTDSDDSYNIEFSDNVMEALTYEKIMYTFNFHNRVWEIEDDDLCTQSGNGIWIKEDGESLIQRAIK